MLFRSLQQRIDSIINTLGGQNMLIKMYKNYAPRASEVYSRIRNLGILSLILKFASDQGLESLSKATQQEIDLRKSASEHTLDKISILKLLQKDSMSTKQLSQLYKLAVRYNIILLATCLQAAMISEGNRSVAKKLFREEFERDNSFIFTELGKGLLVNLYKEPSDDLLSIEDKALRRFLAEQ